MIGHTFTDGILRWCVYSFHVPAFFFLSFFLSGLCYNGRESTGKYISKRISTIVVPYLFFSVISILLFWAAGKFFGGLKEIVGDSLLKNLVEMLYGNSKLEKMRYNLPLWFLPCFFSVSMLVFFEEKIRDKTTKWISWIFAVICVGLGLFFSRNETIALPWHIETAFSMSVWFVLGIQGQRHIKDLAISRKVAGYLIAALCLTGGILLSFTNNRIVGVRNEHYGIIPIYYLSAMTTIVGIVLLSKAINKSCLLEYIGMNSLGVLVLHKLPILVFQKLIRFTQKAMTKPDSLGRIFVGFVAAGITILFSLAGI